MSNCMICGNKIDDTEIICTNKKCKNKYKEFKKYEYNKNRRNN